MTPSAKHGLGALTEKEKQTLRMIVRGHDAKSIARSLGLSVHTINERLREARRKVAVSSSREAARLLFEAENGHPESHGDIPIGDAATPSSADREAAPIPGAGRRPWLKIGAVVMLPALALLAVVVAPQLDVPTPSPSAATEAPNAAVVDAARQWLTLLDQSRWEETYNATATAFRKLNTLQVWTATSLQARAPLGAVTARTLLSEETLPAPPHGYEVVKFRTQFAAKTTVETVTLDREEGQWRVVGIMIG